MTHGPIVTPSADKLVDLHIAHLNMVQGAVSRMAGFSASAKTFCVTILAAIIALAIQAGTAKLAFGAIVAVVCLGLLDLYYLTLELRFRSEYERIAQRPLSDAADLRIKPAKFTAACFRKAATSLSILLFYIPILLACIGAFVYGPTDERKPIQQVSGRSGEGAVGARRPERPNTKADGPERVIREATAATGVAPLKPGLPTPKASLGIVRADGSAITNTNGAATKP